MFDQERASQLGLAVRDIADRVVSNVRGDVATRYRLQRQEDRRARAQCRYALGFDRGCAQPHRQSRARCAPVPLSAVADVQLAVGPAEIRRANQERVAVISAHRRGDDLGGRDADCSAILLADDSAAGRHQRVRSPGRAKRCNRASARCSSRFALAVFLVYLVMASQFESLLHPLVILFTIPLALIGAVWALVRHRHDASTS